MALAFRRAATLVSIHSRHGSHALADGLRPGSRQGGARVTMGLWPVLNRPPGRASPLWPVLIPAPWAVPPAARLAKTEPRPLSGTWPRFPAARLFVSESAAATSPAAPAPTPAVSFPQSRHCSRRRSLFAPSRSMSRLVPMAGFEVTLYGRFWVTPEVKPSQTYLKLSDHHPSSAISPVGYPTMLDIRPVSRSM